MSSWKANENLCTLHGMASTELSALEAAQGQAPASCDPAPGSPGAPRTPTHNDSCFDLDGGTPTKQTLSSRSEDAPSGGGAPVRGLILGRQAEGLGLAIPRREQGQASEAP